VTLTETGGTRRASFAIAPAGEHLPLHYVFDLWAERWRRHRAQRNQSSLVRMPTTSFLPGFEHQARGLAVPGGTADRWLQFCATLQSGQDRLIHSGVLRGASRPAGGGGAGGAGLGRPETFDFLCFTPHICGRLPTRGIFYTALSANPIRP